MKKRYGGAWALLAVAALVVSACGGPGATTRPAATGPAATGPAATTQATTGTGGSPAAGACPASAQGKTVEMWSPLTGPDGDEMTALAQQFSSENTSGVTVNHVAQPEYIQKLTAAAAGNTLPAMTVIRVINVGELAARNVLRPFSADVMGALGSDFATAFPENAWVRGEYNGERYSVPLDIHPLVMYYNADMFETANVEAPGTEPWTAAEFDAALVALQESGVQPLAMGTAFQGATLFQSYIVQYGGALASEDGTTVTFNSDAGVAALNKVKELRDTYGSDVSGPGDPEVGVFKQGEAAIVFHGPWHISDLQKDEAFDVEFAPLPQVGDQFAVWAGSHQLALTTDDPGTQTAAACWIAWLSENSAEWAAAGQVPARNDIREGDELGTVAPAIAAVAPSADNAILLPQVPALEGALWDQFGPVVDGVLAGDVTDVAAALNDAAGRAQQTVNDNAEQFAPTP